MKKNKPIGIFDSGIGGVTVLKEIIKILPMKITYIIVIVKIIHMGINQMKK